MKYYVEGIYKEFNGLKVLDNISMNFRENQVTCILGPSGCGKSTLLNILTSILKAESGRVEGFKDRDISFIFQEDRLIEWRTVKENIDFVLKDKLRGNSGDKLNKSQREEIIDKYLEMVNLEEYKNYYPRKLSGGMRQRVSIARAFAFPSEILIMDEPFKSLDMNTKYNLMKCFSDLREKDNRTVVFVTHEVDEAITLGDEIIVLTDKPTTVKKKIENSIHPTKRWEKTKEVELLKEEVIEAILSK